jgi:hypothetical protein
MYALADGGGPFAAMVVALITIGLGGGVGWWLRRLITPLVISTPGDVGRQWVGWIVFLSCVTLLSRFFGTLSIDAFFPWVTTLVIFSAAAYCLGWAYGNFFKFGNGNAAPTSNSAAAFAPSTPVTTALAMSAASPILSTLKATSTSSTDITMTAPTQIQAPTFDEDAVYEIVANEMESGKTDKGLWTRLYAECDGDEKNTKIAYIKQRAGKLMVIERARIQEQERQMAEVADRYERLRLENMSLREKLSSENITPEMQEIISNLSSTQSAVMFLNMVRLNQIDQVSASLDDNPLYAVVTNSEGMSPLHISASERYIAMSELLIQRGAPVGLKNAYGQTPLDLANASRKQELVALFSAMC